MKWFHWKIYVVGDCSVTWEQAKLVPPLRLAIQLRGLATTWGARVVSRGWWIGPHTRPVQIVALPLSRLTKETQSRGLAHPQPGLELTAPTSLE
jgi:hypothetical protein